MPALMAAQLDAQLNPTAVTIPAALTASVAGIRHLASDTRSKIPTPLPDNRAVMLDAGNT
jgi:hypothetical protein